MGIFAKQIDKQRRLDEEELEEAYAKLAASVSTSKQIPRKHTIQDARAIDFACEQILRTFNLEPADVPPDVEDSYERLERALAPTGVMMRSVRLERGWWRNATGAYLGRLKQGTPVAIIPAGLRGYAYVDPITKEKVAINRKVEETIEPDALCFYGPLPAESLTPTGLVVHILKSLGAFDYAVIVLATLVVTAAGLAPIIATKLLFSVIIPSGSASLILPFIFMFIGMIWGQALYKLVSSLLSARISTRLKLILESSIYGRIMFLETSFFKKEPPGSIASRLLGIPELASSLCKAVFEVGLTALMSLIYIFQILRYTPSLALPAFVTFLIEVVLATIALRANEGRYLRRMEWTAKLSGIVPDLLHGIQKIKLGGAESRAFAYWVNHYARSSRVRILIPTLTGAAPSLIPLIASLGIVVIYGIAVTTGVATDDFMAFNAAFGAAAGAINALSTSIPTIAKIKPRLEALRPILEAKPESLGNKRQVESIDGSVTVSNISFRYDKDLPLVLDNVSFRVRAGEYVAIVGHTGCGKSTLMRVLLGFEQPQKGTVQYGPYDIDKVDVRSVRRHMGVVLQDGKLFSGDLFSNITVANPTATLDDAWEAAELADIADDIRAMPMGMHTLVGANGGGFSGGQRQRIMIARAVCGKPSVLLLDEATSALDNVAQQHVTEALDRLDCTRIVIAHRLSTIRSCDRIIMLDKGHIVEEGSYEELVARGGAFADLVRRQRLEDEI